MSDPWPEDPREREVRDLLQRLVAAPPPEPITTAEIVRRARHSRRRRQTIGTLTAAALVVVVAAVGAVVVPRLVDGNGRTGPAAGTQAPTKALSSAVEVAPSDLDTQLNVTLPLPASTRSALASFSGGAAQVVSGPVGASRSALQLRAVQVLTTSTRAVPPPPGTTSFPESAAGRALDGRSLVQITTGRATWLISTYDVAGRTWQSAEVDPASLGSGIKAQDTIGATRLAGGRVWFTVVPAGQPAAAGITDGAPLFSAPLRTGRVRAEGVEVGAWDAGQLTLAWTTPGSRGGAGVKVRDLDTGRETTVAVTDARVCRRTSLAVGHDRIAVTDACGGSTPDQVQLVDVSGRQLVSLRGVGLANAHPGSRHLAVSSASADNPGVFVWDLETGDLTRLSSTPVTLDLVVDESGIRSLVPALVPPRGAQTGVSWLDLKDLGR